MIKVLPLEKMDDLNDYTIIVPSYMELYYKSKFINKNVNVLNIKNFLSSIYTGYEKILDDNENFIIMYEAVKKVSNKLSIYKDFISGDFIKELIKTYDLFYKVTLSNNDKQNDLQLIYSEYEKELKNHGLINERLLLKKVADSGTFNGNYAFALLDEIDYDMLRLIKKISDNGNLLIFDCIYNNLLESRLKKIDDSINFSSFNDNYNAYYKNLNDVSDEVAFISNDVCKRIMENEKYKDFLITGNNINKYEPYFNLFLNHSYSKNLVSGILTSRFINVFVKILKGDFSCKTFLEMLKLDLFDVSNKMIDKLDNYVYSYNLQDENFYLPFTLNPSGNKSDFTLDDESFLKTLNDAKTSVILPIKYLIENIIKDARKTEILRYLYTYLSEEKIIDVLYEKDYEGALKLTEAFDIINDNLSDDAKLSDVVLALENINYTVTSKSNMQDEITICNLNEANALDKKYVYITSFEDKNVPINFSLDGLLNNYDIKKDDLISLIDEHYEKEKNKVKRLLKGKNVIITSHKLDLDLSIKTPSSYLSWINLKEIENDKLYDKSLILNSYSKLLSDNKINMIKDIDLDKINDFNLHDIDYKVKLKPKKVINLSPSAIENYAKCPFYYLCNNILKLKVKEKYIFDKRQIGIFIHYVLEKIIKNDLSLITINNLDEYVLKYTNQYLKENNINLSNTVNYLIKKLKKNVSLIVQNIISEKKISSFKPRYFEFKIDDNNIIKPVIVKTDDVMAKVSGIVDRIDVYEDNDNYYYVVIDYKTGDKKFRLDDVLMGLNMQMLLYLLAVKKSGDLTNKNLIPSGLLYYPALIKDSISSRDLKIEQKEETLKEKLKENGIINKDERVINLFGKDDIGTYLAVKKRDKLDEECLFDLSSLDAIFNNINNTIINISKDINNGIAKASPIGGRIDPCLYCPFSSICKFDMKIDKKRKPLDYKNEEVLKMLEGDNNA